MGGGRSYGYRITNCAAQYPDFHSKPKTSSYAATPDINTVGAAKTRANWKIGTGILPALLGQRVPSVLAFALGSGLPGLHRLKVLSEHSIDVARQRALVSRRECFNPQFHVFV